MKHHAPTYTHTVRIVVLGREYVQYPYASTDLYRVPVSNCGNALEVKTIKLKTNTVISRPRKLNFKLQWSNISATKSQIMIFLQSCGLFGWLVLVGLRITTRMLKLWCLLSFHDIHTKGNYQSYYDYNRYFPHTQYKRSSGHANFISLWIQLIFSEIFHQALQLSIFRDYFRCFTITVSSVFMILPIFF